MAREEWDYNGQSADAVQSMELETTTSSESMALASGMSVNVYPPVPYDGLENLPTLDGSPIVGDYLLGDGLAITDKTISVADGIVKRVRVATKAQWAVEPTYIPARGQLIIYSDYMTVSGKSYAGVKIGDGTTYIADLPFLCGELKASLESHVSDALSHVSAADRAYWNNKHRVSEVVNDEVLEITF